MVEVWTSFRQRQLVFILLLRRLRTSRLPLAIRSRPLCLIMSGWSSEEDLKATTRSVKPKIGRTVNDILTLLASVGSAA